MLSVLIPLFSISEIILKIIVALLIVAISASSAFNCWLSFKLCSYGFDFQKSILYKGESVSFCLQTTGFLLTNSCKSW